jgi:hypothetical protein
MTELKKIHTGTYIFGNQEENSSFGGVSGTISLPSYVSDISFFINDTHQNTSEDFGDTKFYTFNIKELEAIHLSIGRVINDLKKLESLSKKDLLRDEAYHK